MDINTILTWPLLAISQRKLLYGGAAVATAYYIGGGWPNQGQSWMTLAQGYLGGGVVFSVLLNQNFSSSAPFMRETPPERQTFMTDLRPGLPAGVSSAALY